MQNLLLYPLFAMVFVTLVISHRLLVLRYRAVRSGELSPAYFKCNRGAKPPEYLVRVTQHYENLFESPVLFYVAVVLIYITNNADYLYLALLWSYVSFRVIHAYVHTTYNNILHRRNIFLLSVLVLYGIWGRLLVQLLVSDNA